MVKFGTALLSAAAVSVLGASPSAAATILQKFDGVSLRDFITASNGFGTTPPDMAGAVSNTHVMQVVNGGVAIFDRSGNRLSYQRTDQFISAAGVPVSFQNSPFDPRLKYDPNSKRFFGVMESVGPPGGTMAPSNGRDFPKLGEDGESEGAELHNVLLGPDGNPVPGQQGVSSTPNNPIYVFVSKTSNPLDGFNAVKFNTSQSLFGDFPTLGLTRDALTITTNDFDDHSLQSVSIFSIPKADLLQNAPSLANMTRLEGLDPALFGFAVQGVNNDGPSNGTQKLVAISAVAYNQENISQLAFNGNGRVVGLTPEGATAILYDGDTRGSRQPVLVSPPLDGGGDRISNDVHQVGNYIYVTHTYGDGQFGAPTHFNGIAYEIIDATTNLVVAQGNIEDPNMDFTHSSITPDSTGKYFALAYTGSGPDHAITAYANVCTFDSVALSTHCGNRLTVMEGLDPGYVLTLGGDRNRWGDYSDVQWDQLTGTFWLFQEYPGLRGGNAPPNSGRWNTVISQISVPEPATWAMMMLGFGFVGFGMRRTRRPTISYA
ncbi:hypothetical protein SCH01S_45_00120 [Sphingomonas changbaiensis NBRC 104936]|uniref:Ice-binding protein C-terminal domain-containing protein n=1 Tax=Sphingomonas changbaiensis NBRC 104936 TaxID=1219043 RepID=A0A0E9MRI6_9SPHN|nr:PEPxxWA-CTERM sorting domain-containing protein [Sphingomonas changbaiensis]GAO40169.1 hypothetical protein SCH01S_45_00120 [Sphingomonas changbaiensis NBRC 104936]